MVISRRKDIDPAFTRLKLAIVILLLLIDAAAIVGLGALLYDFVSVRQAPGRVFALLGSLLLITLGFTGWAMFEARRGWMRLAMLLAALPAAPAVFAGLFILNFAMTFHHQP